jgi:dienelactone hydrolase
MYTTTHFYTHDHLTCEGYLAAPDDKIKRPAVLIAHDWTGRNAFACQQAESLAELGYVGIALDMYGNGTLGENDAEKMALMQPLIHDRALLQARLLAGFNSVSRVPYVDASRIAIIGFCFGGLCALDLARSGAAITSAISFHGLLTPSALTPQAAIKANILVVHGYEDPLVKPHDLLTFCDEMTQANVDWQMHVFSQTQHSFMVPQINLPDLGKAYQPRSAARAHRLLVDFLQEQFQAPPHT